MKGFSLNGAAAPKPLLRSPIQASIRRDALLDPERCARHDTRRRTVTNMNFRVTDPMKLRVMHAFGKGALFALCQLACSRTQWGEESDAPFAGYLDISGVEDVLLYMTLVRATFRLIQNGDWATGPPTRTQEPG